MYLPKFFHSPPSLTRIAAPRAAILCEHFPDRQEEAFDAAFKYSSFGSYEAMTELPAYAQYLKRRKASSRSAKGWRWEGRKPYGSLRSQGRLVEIHRLTSTNSTDAPPGHRAYHSCPTGARLEPPSQAS